MGLGESTASLIFRISADSSSAKKEIKATADEAVLAQRKVAAEAQVAAAQSKLAAIAAKVTGAENAKELAEEAKRLGGVAQTAAQGLKVAQAEAKNVFSAVGTSSKQSSKLISELLTSITGLGSQSKLAGAVVTDLSGSIESAGASVAALINPATIAVVAVAALGAAAVIAGKELFDLAESGSAFGEKIYESSVKTGLSVETVSALTTALAGAGLEFSRIEPGLIIFEKLLANGADSGKKATKILGNIGIDSKTGFKDLEGSLNQVFIRAGELATQVERTKLFTDAFGKSGAEMAKVYDETGGNLAKYTEELKKAGLTLSGEDTEASHEFQKALRELHNELEILTVKFVRGYLPQIKTVLSTIYEAFKSNEAVIKDAGKAVGEFLSGLGKIAEFITAHPIIEKMILGGLRAGLAATTGGLSELAYGSAKGVQVLGQSDSPAGTISDANDRFHHSGTLGNSGGVTAQLPQSGQGFTTYGDHVDQFGTLHTIESLKKLSAAFEQATGKIIAIGNIGQEGGGNFGSHIGHGRGDSADVRPITRDGRGEPTNFRDSNYDREATRELINLIKQQNPNAKVLFNDPQLIKEGLTAYYQGHDNHLHVKIPDASSRPYVGAEDEEKIQKAKQKAAEQAFKAANESFKTLTKEQLEAHRDQIDALKVLHDKELAAPQKVYADNKAENDKFTQATIAAVKKNRADYIKEIGSFEEKPEDYTEKLADYDAQIKDATIEGDRKNRELLTDLHKSQLELSRKYFSESENLKKELDSRTIANINDNASREAITYTDAENAVYAVRQKALDRLAAQYAEETRINKAGANSKTEQQKIDNETAKNNEARKNLDDEHKRNLRDSRAKDFQVELTAAENYNKTLEEADAAHYARLQIDLDNFLITKETFAKRAAEIDEKAIARQIALKQLELSGIDAATNPKDFNRVTDEITALDNASANLRAANQHKIAVATRETTDAMKAQVAEAAALHRQAQSEAANLQIRELQRQLDDNKGKDSFGDAERIHILEQIRALKLQIIQNDYDAAAAQDAIDKAQEEKEVASYADTKKRQEEIDEKYADRKKNRDAARAADKANVNQQTEDQAGISKDDGILASIHDTFQKLRKDDTIKNATGALKEFGKIGLQVLSDMKHALGASIEQWVLYGGSIAQALKQALAAELAHVAGMAAIKALEATALGFLDLAYGNFVGAGHAFVSAGLWAALAGGSALAGRALSGNQNSAASSSAFNSQTATNGNIDLRNSTTGANNNNGSQRGTAGAAYSSLADRNATDENRLYGGVRGGTQIVEHRHVLEIKSNDSHIVKVVKDNANNRGDLHSLIFKVANA